VVVGAASTLFGGTRQRSNSHAIVWLLGHSIAHFFLFSAGTMGLLLTASLKTQAHPAISTGPVLPFLKSLTHASARNASAMLQSTLDRVQCLFIVFFAIYLFVSGLVRWWATRQAASPGRHTRKTSSAMRFAQAIPPSVRILVSWVCLVLGLAGPRFGLFDYPILTVALIALSSAMMATCSMVEHLFVARKLQ
jgi:hypothetical protein